jgi:CheY-like chemotaxis protein/anti-sigma regulatory factor (Ser/Thr protein kinase)
MRILVADDDALFHKIAGALLRLDGHEVVHAKDGLEALAAFQAHRPNLVLTDYRMPGLNGIELCRRIKALDPARFIPVIMLTGDGESKILRESLEAGVVEVLNKPVNPDELRLRVRSLAELITLHSNLALAKGESDEEMLITKHILHRLVEPGLRALPDHIHMETLQTQRINGDACAYHPGLPGVHFGFLCDATGHGLTAGVSTIPAIHSFLRMATRDVPLEIIYRKINTRLRQILPTGRFVCLMLVRLDLHRATLSVLNAGLPDALLHGTGGIIRRFPSRNLPPGVLDQVGPPMVEQVAITGGERLLAFTDGIQEVPGDQEAYRILMDGLASLPFDQHRGTIQSRLKAGIQDHEQQDDVSWTLWEIPKPNSPRLASRLPKPGPVPPSLITTLAFELAFDPQRHPVREILPDCLRLLSGHGVSREAGQTLALALTEAMMNTVDHGLSRLEAAADAEPASDAPDRGTVTLRIRLGCDGERRVRAIGVEVEDSGDGFDWRSWEADLDSHEMAGGRGLLIVRSLSSEMSFNEAGNCLRFTLPCG